MFYQCCSLNNLFQFFFISGHCRVCRIQIEDCCVLYIVNLCFVTCHGDLDRLQRFCFCPVYFESDVVCYILTKFFFSRNLFFHQIFQLSFFSICQCVDFHCDLGTFSYLKSSLRNFCTYCCNYISKLVCEVLLQIHLLIISYGFTVFFSLRSLRFPNCCIRIFRSCCCPF